MPEPRDVPEGFVQFVLGMDGGGYLSLSRHWHTAIPTIHRWLRETGLTDRVNNPPPPKSWGDIAPTKNKVELSAHYKVTTSVILRWIQLTGINARPKRQLVLSRAEARDRAAIKYSGSKDLEAAAHFLRRHYPNVHRADIYLTTQRTWGQARGLPDKGRGRYYVDSIGVIGVRELLELAKRHGYNGAGI